MSHATPNELSLQIVDGEFSYEVYLTQDPDSGNFSAKAHFPKSSSRTLGELIKGESAVQGNRILLESRDFAMADDELRALLCKHRLSISITNYWYIVNSPSKEELWLEDCDPEGHTIVRIGNFDNSFSTEQSSSIAFMDELSQNKFCAGCSWSGYEIEVRLSPSFSKENRLEVFKELVSLYRPEHSH